MYRKQVKSENLRIKRKGFKSSFTLIEVIVVMGVMGLIIGGLLVSMRQIIESEMLLKKMQAVEEESRFIMDLFAQNAQYSELKAPEYTPSTTDDDIFSYVIKLILTEKKEELEKASENMAEYLSYYQETQSGKLYYLQRNITGETEDLSVTLNSTPFVKRPVFRIKRLESPDGAANYLVTISLVFFVENGDNPVYVPIQTSVVSRTFEI